MIYSFKKGEFINRFLVSDIIKTDYVSKDEIMTYPINNKNLEWSEITYPVRKQFLEEFNKGEHLKNPSFLRIDNFHFPFENNKIEFTNFSETPSTQYFFAKTTLLVDESKIYDFKLATAGCVKIWINGTEITTFAPFTRNTISHDKFSAYLNQGENEIVIYALELAERDTEYFFALQCEEDIQVKVDYPYEDKALSVEKSLWNAYFPKNNFTSGEVYLNVEPVDFDYEIDVTYTTDPIDYCPFENTIIVPKGSNKIVFDETKNIPFGVINFNLTAKVENVEIKRTFCAEIFDEQIADNYKQKYDQTTFDGRRRSFLEFSAKYGTLSSFTLISIFESGVNLEMVEEILTHDLNYIDSRADCSDFILVPLLSMLISGRHKFTDKQIKRITNTIINFRYYYDEPGHDVMWYFSENHALGFYTCQLLAGELFQDQIFTNSGRTGKELQLIAKKRIIEWFDLFFEQGLVEWNSTPYIPIDLISFLALYDWSHDTRINKMAHKGIDYLFDIMGKFSYQGRMFGATQGRTYTKELFASNVDAINGFNYFSSGQGQLSVRTKSLALLAISKYSPDDSYLRYVNGEPIATTFKQGGADTVELVLKKTPKYTLSYTKDFKPFCKGHQEHIFGIMFGNDIAFWINHPGEENPFGQKRPSFWAGNGTLPKIFEENGEYTIEFDNKYPGEFPSFTHAYFPIEKFDSYKVEGNVASCTSNGTILFIESNNELELISSGVTKDYELRSYGLQCTWKIKIGEHNGK